MRYGAVSDGPRTIATKGLTYLKVDKMTYLWFRNPDRAMVVLAQEGVARITWTRQHLARLRIDGIAHARQFYMHTPIRPRIMLIGIQGTSEYTIMSKLDQPLGVYPTWSGKNDSWDDLLDMIEKPWGEDASKCTDPFTPSALRPVFDQKHRVIIHNGPPVTSGAGKRFWANVARVQEDYPECELFVNGPSSFAALFGLDFKAVDFGLSDAYDINQVLFLPSGVKVNLGDKNACDRLYQWEDWIKVVGFTVDEIIKDQNKRFAFRIRSARWAASHWKDNFRFHRETTNIEPEQIDQSDYEFVPRSSRSIITRRKLYTVKEAEKVLCNRCKIAPGCKLFRSGSVCGYGDSSMSDLTRLFGSRSAARIIDGLSEVLKLQANRLEASIQNEASSDEIDPDVTRQMNSLFKNGTQLAKLLDPALSGPGTNVQVNVGIANGNAASVASGSPKEMIAGVVAALEAQGIARENITPDMIQGVLKGMATGDLRSAIEAQRELPQKKPIEVDPFLQSDRILNGLVVEESVNDTPSV